MRIIDCLKCGNYANCLSNRAYRNFQGGCMTKIEELRELQEISANEYFPLSPLAPAPNERQVAILNTLREFYKKEQKKMEKRHGK